MVTFSLTEEDIILDVRTPKEFEAGHITGAINIPLDLLKADPGQLKDKNKRIITCCASGIRSASAVRVLKSNGFTNVQDGGGWISLLTKLN